MVSFFNGPSLLHPDSLIKSSFPGSGTAKLVRHSFSLPVSSMNDKPTVMFTFDGRFAP